MRWITRSATLISTATSNHWKNSVCGSMWSASFSAPGVASSIIEKSKKNRLRPMAVAHQAAFRV
jgi:hypothetical protein